MDLVELTNNTNRHPWELSRTKCIINEIKKISKKTCVLDIGFGDKYFDECLVKSDNKIKELYGVDTFSEKCEKKGICTWLNSYDKLENKKFDVIIMMDVLEHIEKDKDFLEKIVRPLLKKEGKIILTVPAYQFLFSNHDIALKHFRRYNIKQIKKLCVNTKLKVTKYNYFYFSLLIPRLLTKKKEMKASSWKYNENHFTTKLIERILNFDYKICKFFSKISMGLSLFAVIEKDNK